jgi:hypothetical protein
LSDGVFVEVAAVRRAKKLSDAAAFMRGGVGDVCF